MPFPWFGYKKDDAATAFRCIELMNELRENDGASITLLCLNPETECVDETECIEVCDQWTHWTTQRFYGRTLEAALVAAVNQKRKS